MGLSYRTVVRRCIVAALSLCLCLASLSSPAAAAAPAVTSGTVAGWVDAQPEVVPYVVLRVVDDKSGVVVRSAPLDATRTFSFAGIAPGAFSVEAVAQLPDHLFELDAASSVLKAAAPSASSTAAVQLKIVTKAKAAPAAQKAAASSSAATTSSPASAVLALAALVAAWYGRHRLISLLDMPTFKPPKQRKVMMAM